MESVLQDVRYVARSVVRNPGFFIVTALTLALGIAATTAIFSVVNAVLIQPLPYPRSERIVQLFPLDKTGTRNSSSEPNFADWQSQARGFSSMAMVSPASTITVNGLSEPARARATFVTRGFLPIFGLTPEAGRAFAESELRPGGAPEAIVSHSFSQKYLGGSRTALGRTITVGTRLYTVVGVMPPEMNYPAGNEIWLPQEIEEPNPSRTSGGKRVIARLRDGVTLAQARQDLSALTRRLKQEYGDETLMSDAEAVTLHEQLVGDVRTTLFVLLGASAFLLLIACANVVSLLLARMSVRRGEIGVRLALGASRWRLAQQLLTEAALLSLLGGVAGIALAAGGIRLLVTLQNGKLPRADEIHLNVPVLLFAVGVSALVALALGVLTAWKGTQPAIRDTLSSSQRTQAGSDSSARIRQTLVVSQMALTVVLLVGAGVLGRSFARLLDVQPGYRTEHAVILDATLPNESGPDAARRRVAFYNEVMARASAIPGVGKVGGANGLPLIGGEADGRFIILTRPDEKIDASLSAQLSKDPARSGDANFMVVDGSYFEAMNIPVLRGRAFRAGDGPDAPHVGVISASLAKAKWPNEDPIGKIIQYGNMDGDLRPFTVVGVVGDVREQSLASEPQPTFYAYFPQRVRAARKMYVVMETAGDPAPVMASVRAIVRELRPDVPPVLKTLETVVSTSVADRKFVLLLVAVFGGAALLLATLGVYSVISYIVTQRQKEIGVRIALGAQRGDVLGLVLRQGALLAVIGIAVGAVGALAMTRLLRGLVFGVSTTDPVAFAGVIVLLVSVALVASWLPARRAARVDPMNVLRGS
jgi:putative ABC transport system permease protein